MTQVTDTSLRIAVLNRSFDVTGGGAERYSISMVEQLAQRHEVHVFAQHIRHHWPGVRYHTVWTPCVKPRWVNQLWFAFSSWWATRKGFDIVHSHENTWHGQVQTVHVLPIKYTLLHGRTGLKKAFRWVKILTSPRLLAYLLLERTRYLPREMRKIIVTSPSLGSVMKEAYPQAVSMLEVVTPGVSTVPGPPDALAKRNARMQLALPQDGLGVLFVANDFKKKGLATLINALPYLSNDMFLIVVGPEHQAKPYGKKLHETGQHGRVYFIGQQTEMDNVYVAADCLAHPTLEDTFGMVVLEAMSHGLPVVVSDVTYCGIAGLLTDGTNALVLKDPTDYRTLAHSIVEVAKDPTLRVKLETSSLDFCRSYLWTEIGLKQEKVYRSLLSPVKMVHKK